MHNKNGTAFFRAVPFLLLTYIEHVFYICVDLCCLTHYLFIIVDWVQYWQPPRSYEP
jgi:hypothetical protein